MLSQPRCVVLSCVRHWNTERFWDHMMPDTISGCWVWSGFREAQGYGRLSFTRGRRVQAHRLAWELTNGPIPGGMEVCHRCDNPPCCNPEHLWLGTTRDNQHDKIAKNRQARGERNGRAKLSAVQAREIIRRYHAGESQRSLAKAFGLAMSSIQRIRSGEYWKDIPADERSYKPLRRLDSEQIEAARRRQMQGESVRAIARSIGIHHSTLQRLLNREVFLRQGALF